MNKLNYPLVLTLVATSLFIAACSDKDTDGETAGQKLDGAIATSKTKLAQTQDKTSELYQQAIDSSKETLDEAQVMLDKTTDATSDTYDKVVGNSGKLLEQGKDKASELADEAKTSLKKGCEKVKDMMDSQDKDC
ncbi:MAG: ElaB/YqjD/DUF883 family membrane-anchored ribosome-binding protein [Paraglaciecola sp.]|jgi:ElaB/YqjD/DUF883 family membrane-anchored ribosome-binding protein